MLGLRSRGVRVVLGLGGWNDSAGDKYSRLINNASARRKFIVHALDFIEQFGFDGLDLDWEYPKCWQVSYCEWIVNIHCSIKIFIKDNKCYCHCDQIQSVQADCEKGPSSDKEGFTNLVKELRTAFNRRGLLLSAAVSASKRIVDAGKLLMLSIEFYDADYVYRYYYGKIEINKLQRRG